MAYIAPIHRSSSVRHALQVRLLPEGEPCLVLAKSNRLEVWQLADGRLTLTHSKTIHGTIVMLQALQPKDSATEMLLVGTDRFRYFSVIWNQHTRELETLQEIHDQAEQFVRDVTTRNKCLVDPSGRFVAMLVWSGVLNVMRLPRRKAKHTNIDWLDQSRISELYIKDAAFLYAEDAHPRVAFLYQSRPNIPESKLVTYRLCSDDKDTEVSRFDPAKDREINIDIPDPGAAILIPVERVDSEKRHNFRNPDLANAHLGGLLVIGETRVLYIDDMTKATVEAALPSSMVFVAWTKYDASHYILADDYGGLHLLTLDVGADGVVVKDIIINVIGKSSRASEIVYMDSGYLFVGSHSGDSELLRLDLTSEEEDKPLAETAQILPSIAPILDFTVMDMGNREGDSTVGNEYSSGQARIVTGSGAHKDGSLRSVRSGVSLEDIGILADLQDIRGLFSLRLNGETSVLVASFLTETRVFTFDAEGEIEEVETFQGLDLSVRTLLVANLDDDRILQITEHNVSVISAEDGITISSWAPPADRLITSCSNNGRWVLLSIDGTVLVSLQLDGLTESAQRESSPNDQISCLFASPHLLDTGAVGFWTTGSVSIISLSTLNVIHSEKLRRTEDDAIVPRDLVLARVLPADVAGPMLSVSMDDGEVVTFTLTDAGKLSARKSVVLGTRQARFHVLPQPNGGIASIFVTSEHSSLIYGSDKRVIYSAVTAESATYVCPFDTAAFPGSLAVATDSQLRISKIDPQRQSHVQSLPMGENVRSIAYSASTRVFGLGCIRRELSKGVETASSTFRLVDEVVFQPLGRPFEFNEGEVVETVIRAQLPDSFGNPAERFVVGTRFLADDSPIPGSNSKGRVLVFGVDEERSPFQVVSHPLKSGCRRLAVMDDMIVVALTKTVVVARYEELSTTSGRLVKVASYQTTTYAIDVAVEGRLIAVADIMKSMSLVEFVPPAAVEDGKQGEAKKAAQLVEVCRHYQSSWSTAVAHVEADSWLEADADGNLVVLRRNVGGVTLEDRRRMEITSEINLGENVNRIQKVTVETGPNAPIVPKAFLSTTEGSIYLFGVIAPDMQDLLINLQERLESYVETLGNIPFRNYRSFRNAEREADGPVRFVDGEFVERFLDMDEETQALVCQDLGPGVEDMRNLVAELKNMH